MGGGSEPDTYGKEPALHTVDFSPDGFEWIDCNDRESSAITFLRKGKSPDELVIVACNFTPVPRQNYRIGVPRAGMWKEILNSDATLYGSSGQGSIGGVRSYPVPFRGRFDSINVVLPPLGILSFKWEELT